MICYYYPPLLDVGCKRSVAFAKYFKKADWNPIVLSVKNPDKTYCVWGEREHKSNIPTTYSNSIINYYNLLGEINGLLAKILRLFNLKLKRNYFYEFLCIPDVFLGWVPMAVYHGLKLIRKHDVSLIYVSCSPFSSALIGVILKKWTGKPLILDYRDPFGLEELFISFKTTKFRKCIIKFLEKKFLSSADIFLVTSEEIKQCYFKQYDFVRDKIYTVHNGYDNESQPIFRRGKKKKFTIIYAGEIYGYAQEYTNFFRALAILKKEGKIASEKFQFLYYGKQKMEIEQIAKRMELNCLVVPNSSVSHPRIIEEIASSHMQWLRIFRPMISTKLYEGIALNIPLLGTIPEGEVAEIIRKYSPASFVVSEQNPELIAQAIQTAMEKYESGDVPENRVQEFLEEFSREKLALRLMSIVGKNLLAGGAAIENC